MTVAEHAGFCFGVERAVRLVEEELARGTAPLYTYGPIIHNEIVVEDLARRGALPLSREELLKAPAGTVVLRSHGLPRAAIRELEERGFRIVDATCPFVKKIHRLVEDASSRGEGIVVVGDPSHAEVQGICGWSRTDVQVIGSLEELKPEKLKKNNLLVSQTTFHKKKFEKIVEKLEKTEYNITVVNTICNATQDRQFEAEQISSRVDSMIVIGGENSSNTRKLYEVCRAHCPRTILIRTCADLQRLGFIPEGSVGITAGASTPKKLIEEVHTYVRSKF